MTLEQLIGVAAEQPLTAADVEAGARELGLSVTALFDDFAKGVARGYLTGRYSYAAGDAAMTALFGYAYVTTGIGLSSFAWQVFEAFDEGEYIHPGEPEKLQGEVRTKSLLARIPHLSDA